MKDYNDILKELKKFADAMSAIPGNAPWSQKISHVAPHLLSYIRKDQIDQLQTAWEQRLKFEIEKLDIRENRAESSNAIALPAIFMGLGTVGGSTFFEGLLPLVFVGLIVLIVGLVLYWWPSYVQRKRQSFSDRIRDQYGFHRFPY